MKNNDVQHIFLVGAKSLGVYGGYETFVNKLTEYHQNNEKIKYHVACKANGDGCMNPKETEGAEIINEHEFIYHNAHCFQIKIPEKLGSAQAIYYDLAALKECCRIIRKQEIAHPVIYILACRIGPFIRNVYKKIHKIHGTVYINPDGHEFMRTKWIKSVRKYWKISEQKMVKWSDLVICDSVSIERYIHRCYDGKGLKGRNPKTTFIAYGAETRKSILNDNDKKFTGWLGRKGIKVGEYYLAVGRFVPENNYEIMIREFMKSNSSKDFVIITTADDIFLEKLEKVLHFKSDKRIKFVGTVYNQELLKKIRENAYGYFHGHEVGGTNPSLLEALGSTNLNLLLSVGFNKEVAGDAAVYWNKKTGSLTGLINLVDKMSEEEVEALGKKAKERIRSAYSWEYISGKYERLFLGRH